MAEKRKQMGTFVLGRHSSVEQQKVMSSHPFLLPHDWLEFYLCRKVPAKKDSLKKAAFMRRS